MDNERSTSFSKNVEGLHHEKNALDKTSPLKDKFEAAKEQDNEPGPHLVDTGRGSDMVKEDAPHLRPTPSGPMRDIPDRYASATKLGKERDEADERIRQAIEAKARQRGKDKDRER